MRRGIEKKMLYFTMTLALMLATVPAVSTKAAEQYTVTFRPGNVAEGFSESLVSQYETKYGKENVEVTSHGAVKITVASEAAMPTAPQAGQVVYKAGNETKYFMMPGKEAEKTVTRNQDFVMDYGKLTNGVEYTVKFVDAESGDSIAPSATAYANIGATVSYTAPESVITGEYGQYQLTSEATLSIELTDKAEDNVLTFTYANQYNPGTTEKTVITYKDGGTVVDYETVRMEQEGEGTVVVQPAADNNNPATDNTAADPNTADDTVMIDEEETPLADSTEPIEDKGDKDTVLIDEEEIPLAAGIEDVIHPMVMVAVCVGVVVILLGAYWIFKRKQSEAMNK